MRIKHRMLAAVLAPLLVLLVLSAAICGSLGKQYLAAGAAVRSIAVAGPINAAVDTIFGDGCPAPARLLSRIGATQTGQLPQRLVGAREILGALLRNEHASTRYSGCGRMSAISS